ncbi:hypothetical protein B0H34DRAFT_362735 [Crassisporium funariophilum]|nr:hypothetical protein B0H34DRAFT_362735 [Crassisporium funariophilum]
MNAHKVWLQEVHLLEENLDNSLREEGSDGPIADLDESNGLQRKAKEQNVRLENELEQMRKRITELEMKHARAIHDLNKELSELEALVESKIYREDELEQEVERLKDKLARYKKTSKSSHEVLDGRHRLSSASTSTTSTESFVGARSEDVCEICERPGHDIFSCSMLKDDIGMNSRQVDKTSVEVFCEDCENPGHVAADCPHSLDVF